MQNVLELEKIPFDNLIENMLNIYKLYTNFLLISKNSRIKLEEDVINNLEKKNTLLNDFKNLLKNNNSSIDKLINQLILLLLLSSSKNISSNINQIYENNTDCIENKIEILENRLRKRQNELNNIENIILSKISKVSPVHKCPICYINLKTHMIYPCGHICLCESCEKKKNFIKKCPICNAEIKDIVKIYDT